MRPDNELSENDIRTYDEVRRYFMSSPQKECVPLLLNSFGEGSGFGVYQLVEDVLLECAYEDVVSALPSALVSPHEGVRYWSAQIAAVFPDERLVPPLSLVLQSPNHDTRAAAIAAIERIHVIASLEGLRLALGKELEPDLRELMSEAIASIEARLR